jgi:hypothetical protein
MGKERERPCRGGDDCDSESHLCKIARGEDPELIRPLVRNALFFCRKCGRAAHDEANLCRPMKI